jgi:hypothetical protein
MSSRSLMSACVGRVSNPAKAERSSASVSAGGESFDPSAYFANAWATHASSHSWACDTSRTNRSCSKQRNLTVILTNSNRTYRRRPALSRQERLCRCLRTLHSSHHRALPLAFYR